MHSVMQQSHFSILIESPQVAGGSQHQALCRSSRCCPVQALGIWPWLPLSRLSALLSLFNCSASISTSAGSGNIACRACSSSTCRCKRSISDCVIRSPALDHYLAQPPLDLIALH